MVLLVNYPPYSNDSGNGQSGTALDVAWLNAQKSSIEDQVHSSTNPTIKPKDITDEVVAARGSKVSLDARLDAALNEDGTPKPQAGIINATQYQAGVGHKNVLVNPNFDRWNFGGTAAPDGWTLTSLSAVQQCGSGQADTTAFGTGLYCARLTRAAGVDGYLLQTIIAVADWTTYSNVKGQSFSVAMKAKTNAPSQLRITVSDGATTTSSSYHTGSNNEEHLSVTHTISQSGSRLEVWIEVRGSNGDAYVGGVQAMFTQLAPSDWQPFNEIPPYVVPTSKVLYTNFAVVGNVGLGEDLLMQYSGPANLLDRDGRGLRMTCWGSGVNNANTKTLKVYAGAPFSAGIGVSIAHALAVSAIQSWRIVMEVLRSSATTSECIVTIISMNTSSVANLVTQVRHQQVTRNHTAGFAVYVTGESNAASNDDISARGMIVELLN